MPLLGAEGCGEQVPFSLEGDFGGVVGNDAVLREKLADSVSPKGERGLETLDAVVEAEEMVEDLTYLVCTGCWDSRPQKMFGGRETWQHSAKASRSNM